MLLNVLSITFPIFCTIALGFLMVRFGVVDKAGIPYLGKFVVAFALPALIFKALSQRTLDDILNLPYLAVYGAGSVLMLAAGFVYAYYRQKKDGAASVLFGLGMSCSNSGFIGYPILLQLLGPVATVALALTMIVENLLILPLAFSLADGSRQHGSHLREILLNTLKGLARNPIILAIVLGACSALLRLKLPAPVFKVVDMAASASGPVALFVIGGTLVGLPLKGMYRDIGLVVTGKLIGHPLAVLAMLLIAPPFDPELQVAAVTAACSPMLSIYPIIGQRYGEEGRCAAALLAGTVLSFFTISVALWLVHAGGFASGPAAPLANIGSPHMVK